MGRASAVADALHRLHNGIIIPPYEELLWHQYIRVIRAGDTVFDIGAHAGFHVDHMLRYVGSHGRVVAFEPLPQLARELKVTYLEHENVEIHQIALGSKTEQSKFYFPTGRPGLAGLKVNVPVGADTKMDQLLVETRMLDTFADYKRVSFVKIDVEGGEIDCLLGGHQFLATHRPIVSVEYGEPTYKSFGHTKQKLFDVAESIGYVLSDLFGNLIRDRAEWDYVCDRAAWDFFLIPAERTHADRDIYNFT